MQFGCPWTAGRHPSLMQIAVWVRRLLFLCKGANWWWTAGCHALLASQSSFSSISTWVVVVTDTWAGSICSMFIIIMKGPFSTFCSKLDDEALTLGMLYYPSADTTSTEWQRSRCQLKGLNSVQSPPAAILDRLTPPLQVKSDDFLKC